MRKKLSIRMVFRYAELVLRWSTTDIIISGEDVNSGALLPWERLIIALIKMNAALPLMEEPFMSLMVKIPAMAGLSFINPVNGNRSIKTEHVQKESITVFWMTTIFIRCVSAIRLRMLSSPYLQVSISIWMRGSKTKFKHWTIHFWKNYISKVVFNAPWSHFLYHQVYWPADIFSRYS